MDFTVELSAFQGVFMSADNVHQLHKLTSKGGNEDKIEFVVQSIKRFLVMEKYIDDNGVIESRTSSVRKFVFYLILNTDLPVMHDMKDLAHIEPLISSIPPVPKHLMCEIIWQLHLENFIYEIIPSCWPQLGLEVAQAFRKNMKYFTPTEYLPKVRRLIAATYGLVCRLTYFSPLDDMLHHDLNETLQKYLKFYKDPPNKHKLDGMTTDELYLYKGECLRSMLHLVNECCNMYTGPINVSSDDEVYKSSYDVKYIVNETFRVCDTTNREVSELLNNINTYILDVFKEVVMDISVDIFCAWSEFTENDKSVQQIIGELCDKVHSKLVGIDSLAEHQVVAMIKMMARKPTSISDVINSTDTATILQNININNEQSPLWIHALVNKEQLCQEPDLVNVISSNLSTFDEEECFKLYNKFKNATGQDMEARERISFIKIELLSRCNMADKHRILREHFRDRTLFDSERFLEEFNVKLNETFNKFIADTNVDFADVLTMFYQNPKKVLIKIFALARHTNRLIEPMLKLMMILKDYVEHYYSSEAEPCLFRMMKYIVSHSLEPRHCKNTIKFISELRKNQIISTSQLLMLVVMPCMHAALVAEDAKRLQIYVQLLMEAFDMNELLTYRAPLLVVSAQIMETMRVINLDKFNEDALQTLNTALKFQKSVINTYRDGIPDNERIWIRVKLDELTLHPLNYYYFKSLWAEDNISFYESVTSQRVSPDLDVNDLALHLVKVMPWSTLEEWCVIWDNYSQAGLSDLLSVKLFHSCVEVLIHTIENSRSMNSLNCLFYIFRNLMHILRYKYFKEPITNKQLQICFFFFVRNLKATNPLDVGDIETIIMPLISYLAERKNDYTINITKYFVNTNFYNVFNRFMPYDNMEQIV